MKRGLFACALLVLPLAGPADEVCLVKNGSPAAKIYVAADDPAPAEWRWDEQPEGGKPRRIPVLTRDESLRQYFANALFDLRRVIEQSSGAELEFVTVSHPEEIKGPAIVVGSLARACGIRPSVTNDLGEAFALRTKGARLYLSGQGIVGDTYAIYAFLNAMGCDWVMPDLLGEVVPEKKTWIADIDREEKPSFAVRGPWLTGGHRPSQHVRVEYEKWQLRTRQQPRPIMVGFQYNEGRLDWPYHQLKAKRNDAWFAAHPDCQAAVSDGKGGFKFNRHQLNTTSPSAVEFEVENIRRIWKKNGWKADESHILRWGPADGNGFDETAASLGIVRGRRDAVSGEWDETDVVFGFMRKVLDAARKEFPNVTLATLVYNNYADFPSRPEWIEGPGLQFTIADITHSRYHGAMDAATSPSRAYYRNVVEQWAKHARRVSFYHYNWNLADAVLPYSRLKIIGRDMPWEHSLGVRGYEDEQLQGESYCAAHDWVQAQLMWNVKQDWRTATETFCRKAYGRGWKPMLEFWLYISDKIAEAGDETGSFFAARRIWSRADAAKLLGWLETAETAGDNARDRRRVRVARHSVDQLVRYLDFAEAYARHDFAAAEAAVRKMCAAIDEEMSGDYPQTTNIWGAQLAKALMLKFAEGAVLYSGSGTNSAYRMIGRLPERMKLQFNPQFNGEKMNLQSPLLNDSEFPEVPTWTTTASAIGLGTVRSGELWYRAKVVLPEVALADGEGVGLFLGGFDCEATVYVNGARVGRKGGFAQPAVFDVTPYLSRAGGGDSIVLCIARKKNCESLTGGILYPCFFFAGPRIPQGDDVEDPSKIVLPGM